jgi:cyclase
LRRIRVIPVLTISELKLVKTVRFKNPKYIGDPLNAIKIFNEKEVDEVIVLDISKSKKIKRPNFNLINKIASECFMPLSYGGGIDNFDSAKKIFDLGVEKIVVNSALHTNIKLIEKIANSYGSQSVVASIDVKRNFFGKKKIFSHNGTTNTKISLENFVSYLENYGIGEIFINNIEKEGTFSGFDLDLIKLVSGLVSVPVIANGGARDISDFLKAYKNGASAVAASSTFVFKNNNTESILINYPSESNLIDEFYSKLNYT